MKGFMVKLIITLAALCGGGYMYFGNVVDLSNLEFTRALTAQGPRMKNVTVFDNGQSSGGVAVSLLESHVSSTAALAEFLSQFVELRVFEKSSDDVVADRVYTGRGKLVQSFADIESGDRLYLVAPDLLFIWPFVERGHRVYIESKDSPLDKPIILESFSDSPRVFHVYNFFSEEEADRLIERILEIDDEKNKLQHSSVGHQSGMKRKSKHRTSENAFDQVSPEAVAMRKRSFELLSVGEYQPDMCDGLQLLRYQQKQAYIPHSDYFDESTTKDWNWVPARGGSNRFATVFLYLSNVTSGGQTVFPKQEMPEDIPEEYNHPELSTEQITELDNLFEKDQWEYDMVQQCRTKLAAYPRKTHAILFYSQTPDGQLDPMSYHGGCPVLSGTKWAANLWVWNKRRYGLDNAKSGSGGSVSVNFVNPLQEAVDLYWSSTKLGTIPAGEQLNFKTYDGHNWLFKVGDKTLHEHKIDGKQGSEQTVTIPSARDEL